MKGGWMVTIGAGSQSNEWTSYKNLNKIIDVMKN
jgi:hypothetical protein